ncbi:MAG: MATE family efflux transporter [Firmicutes bacterium]|nr:MATE family efflux transporter [Bacillota bacterium]
MSKQAAYASDLRSSPVLTAVLTLALPVVAQSLLQVLIGTVDLKMVGVLGADAIAAVGMGRQVIMIIMILVLAISTGAVALVARAVGSDDQHGTSRAIGNAFTLVILFAAVMSPIGLATAGITLDLLGATDLVKELGLDYMRIFYISVVFFLGHFMAKAVFQGGGDTRTPLLIDIIMNIANVLFNWLFIYGVWIFPEMGVAGAAMGTAISRFIGASLGWGALLSGRFAIKVSLPHLLSFDTKGMGEILRIGIPSAFQGAARNISNVLLVAILARTAVDMAAVSAFTVGMNLNQYALMPGLAVGTAAAALSGINLGANDPKRAEASGWSAAGVGAGIMSFFGLIIFIFAPWLLAFFNDDPDMIRVGVVFVRIIALSEPFHALGIVLSRTMQGAGYTYRPFQVTVFSWLFVRTPLAWLLATQTGLEATGVWIAISVTTVLFGLLTLVVFRRGAWKTARVSQAA